MKGQGNLQTGVIFTQINFVFLGALLDLKFSLYYQELEVTVLESFKCTH